MTTIRENASSGFTVEEERAQLRTLMERAPDAVVFMDHTGNIIEWNPSAEKMFGWTRAQALGSAVSDLIVVPRFRDSYDRWFERFSAGEDVDERHRLLGLRRDGSEILVEVTIWAISPGGHERRICSAFIRDLTEQVSAERMRRTMAAIVDSSDDAIIGKDLDGAIRSWNRGAERLYGYRAGEAIGRHISLIIPAGRPDELTMIMERLRNGKGIDHFDTRRRSKTGRIIDVSLTISPVRSTEGDVVGASSIARDVTRRKRLEERRLNEELERRVEQRTAELEDANRKLEGLVASKTDFVASVSHELRTPLTSVIGFAELLMDSSSEFDHPQRLGLLNEIAVQGYELANIVEDLLVAARSEIGDLHVSSVPVNLRAQTAQVVESMRDEEADAIDMSGSAQYVLGDPQRVRQVLRNLITNAIRYGGPHISVSIGEPEDGYASVTVSDDGEGVSGDAHEKIFEPYARGHETKGTTDSFGLGLAISRDLARLMGGDLSYRRVDQTEFVLSLPVSPRPSGSRSPGMSSSG